MHQERSTRSAYLPTRRKSLSFFFYLLLPLSSHPSHNVRVIRIKCLSFLRDVRPGTWQPNLEAELSISVHSALLTLLLKPDETSSSKKKTYISNFTQLCARPSLYRHLPRVSLDHPLASALQMFCIMLPFFFFLKV